MHKAWKWLGLAGAVGVAATGAVVARDQRQRNAYSADDVRERLHERYARAQSDSARSGAESPENPADPDRPVPERP